MDKTHGRMLMMSLVRVLCRSSVGSLQAYSSHLCLYNYASNKKDANTLLSRGLYNC